MAWLSFPRTPAHKGYTPEWWSWGVCRPKREGPFRRSLSHWRWESLKGILLPLHPLLFSLSLHPHYAASRVTACYSLHCTAYILQSTLYSLHRTAYVVQPPLYSLHWQPTLYSLPCTAYPMLYSLHPTVHIVQPTSYSLHYTAYIVQPTSYSWHWTAYLGQLTLYSLHWQPKQMAT